MKKRWVVSHYQGYPDGTVGAKVGEERFFTRHHAKKHARTMATNLGLPGAPLYHTWIERS